MWRAFRNFKLAHGVGKDKEMFIINKDNILQYHLLEEYKMEIEKAINIRNVAQDDKILIY